MHSIVTSSCTAPLGPDPPGLRILRAYSGRIEHEYFALESVPSHVELDADTD